MVADHYVVNLAQAPLHPVVSRSGELLSLQCDLSAQCGLGRLRVSFERIPPGCRQAPPHSHSSREEGFLVLAGRGVAVVAGKSVSVVPGQVLLFAAGTGAHHTLRNDGPEDLDVLLFSADGGDDRITFADESSDGATP